MSADRWGVAVSEALARVSPELVAGVRALVEHERRAVLLAVCALAVQVSDVADGRARDALEALGRGAVGDAAERRNVRVLAEELDVIAWDVRDRVEAGQATDAEYRAAFARARAAAALDQAFGVKSLPAAYETFYEASFAINDLERLKALLPTRG
jgi:hypothetical protein